MAYTTLSTDYDGTIAHDGVLDELTLEALREARAAGIRLILVTGRQLDDLFRACAHCDLFQRIIAENGALLYDPESGSSRSLAPPPPAKFLEKLVAEKIPFSVGRSIVATVEPNEHVVLEAIHQLGLEWHIIFNKGSVMALPSGVNKATGLTCALVEMSVSREEVVGVGDAENDQAFLRMCGLAVAVANALPSVKADADFVTLGARGAGVTELIHMLIADGLKSIKPKPEHHGPSAVPPE